RVDKLAARKRLVARADAVEGDAVAHEGAPAPVHPGAGGDRAGNQAPVLLRLVIGLDESPDPGEEPGRAERVSGLAVVLAEPDLRDEAVVRAESRAEVLVLGEPVQAARAVGVPDVRGVRVELLSGPLARE